MSVTLQVTRHSTVTLFMLAQASGASPTVCYNHHLHLPKTRDITTDIYGLSVMCGQLYRTGIIVQNRVGVSYYEDQDRVATRG